MAQCPSRWRLAVTVPSNVPVGIGLEPANRGAVEVDVMDADGRPAEGTAQLICSNRGDSRNERFNPAHELTRGHARFEVSAGPCAVVATGTQSFSFWFSP